MQKVILTLEDTQNAVILMRLIKEFDFVRSVEFEKQDVFDRTEQEIFTNDLADDLFLDDMQMTVKQFRMQTLQDEREIGMTKQEFFNSMKAWRELIEK